MDRISTTVGINSVTFEGLCFFCLEDFTIIHQRILTVGKKINSFVNYQLLFVNACSFYLSKLRRKTLSKPTGGRCEIIKL